MAKEVKIKVGGETSKYERSMRSVKYSTRKMTQSVQKSWTTAARKIGGALALITAGYGIKSLSGGFLDAAKTTENYRVRLQVLLGSIVEGNRLFKGMADYAGRVPFEYEKIMGAATQLSGVMKGGVAQIKQWMPLIGDLAAAAGLGIEKTTEQVIRMYSAGAASADLFRERGILAMMGFKAGVSYSVEDTRRMMFEAWNKVGSQFKDATGKLSKTWTGMMSMISDKWFQFRTLIMEAGVFDELKKQLKEVNEQFGKWIKNNEALIKQKVPEYIQKTKDAISGIVNIYNSLPAGLISATGYGLVGGMLFGGKAGLIIATVTLLNTQLKTLGLNLGSLADKYRDLNKATGNIWDALTGKKDWRTGQELSPGGGIIVRGKIPPRPTAKTAAGPAGVPTPAPGPPPEQIPNTADIAGRVQSEWNDIANQSAGIWESYQAERIQKFMDGNLAIEQLGEEEVNRLVEMEQRKAQLTLDSQTRLDEFMANEAYPRQLQMKADHVNAMMNLARTEALNEQKMTRLKQQAVMTTADNIIKTGKLIMDTTGKQSKAMFYITQLASAGKAGVYAYLAAAKALAEVPFPYNIAAAASIAALGMAQVANIMKQRPDGGATGSAGTGVPAVSATTAPVVAAAATPGSTDRRGELHIHIDQFVGEESYVDWLIDKINSAGEDRDVYVYATNAAVAENLA